MEPDTNRSMDDRTEPGQEPNLADRANGRIVELGSSARQRASDSRVVGVATSRAMMVLCAAYLYISPVLAQSAMEQGGSICSTPGYNFFLGLILAGCAFALGCVILGVFSGGAMKTFGWVSRSISKMGNEALVGGMASVGLIALTLGIIGVAWGTVDITLPPECLLPFY